MKGMKVSGATEPSPDHSCILKNLTLPIKFISNINSVPSTTLQSEKLDLNHLLAGLLQGPQADKVLCTSPLHLTGNKSLLCHLFLKCSHTSKTKKPQRYLHL